MDQLREPQTKSGDTKLLEKYFETHTKMATLQSRPVVLLPRTLNNKPYIPSWNQCNADIHNFSLSHQFPFIASVRQKFNETRLAVGLDLVVWNDSRYNLSNIQEDFISCFQDSFSKREWSEIVHVCIQNRVYEFMIRWAIKEAYTKALGLGMMCQFNSFEICHASIYNWFEYISTNPQITTSSNDNKWIAHRVTIKHLCLNNRWDSQGTNTQQEPVVLYFKNLPIAEHTNRDHSSFPPFAMLCICLVPDSAREVCIDVEDLSYEELLKWHSKRPMNS